MVGERPACISAKLVKRYVKYAGGLKVATSQALVAFLSARFHTRCELEY